MDTSKGKKKEGEKEKLYEVRIEMETKRAREEWNRIYEGGRRRKQRKKYRKIGEVRRQKTRKNRM